MASEIDYPALVRSIKDKTGKNQAELADLLEVSQPTISRWINGTPPELEHADRISALARNLRLFHQKRFANVTKVPIVGYVGAGGTISFRDGQGHFGEAEMPPKEASPSTVAVIIQGDSMGTLEDGWTVYYDNRRDQPDESLHSKLCIVGLTDGRVLIKKLYPGRKNGHYDLHSVNAPVLLDQPVEWAARITWIAPK